MYGNAFEHFLLEEVRAYMSYRERDEWITFWRTTSGYEVDCVIGQMDCVLEFKSAKKTGGDHLKGLRALKEEHHVRRAILVSREEMRRQTTDGIDLMSWQHFCRELWADQLF